MELEDLLEEPECECGAPVHGATEDPHAHAAHDGGDQGGIGHPGHAVTALATYQGR